MSRCRRGKNRGGGRDAAAPAHALSPTPHRPRSPPSSLCPPHSPARHLCPRPPPLSGARSAWVHGRGSCICRWETPRVSVGAGGEEAKDGGGRQIRRVLRRRAARGRAAPLRADCYRFGASAPLPAAPLSLCVYVVLVVPRILELARSGTRSPSRTVRRSSCSCDDASALSGSVAR